MIRVLFSAISSLFIVAAASAQSVEPSPQQGAKADPKSFIASAPDWVDVQEAVSPADAQFPAYRGKRRLLLDTQAHADGENSATYYRRVDELLSPRAVRDAGSMRLRYDPVYQSVRVHAFNIIRDGKTIDALDEAYIEDMRDEKRLSSNIFEGRRVLYVRIEDLRQGDIVDYSYSFIGENPAWPDTFSFRHSVNYTHPVERIHVKAEWPSEIPVRLRLGNEAQTTEYEAGRTSFTFGPKAMPRQRAEMGAPRGYSAYKKLEIGSFEDWGAVNDIARPYFEAPENSVAFDALAEKIMQEHATFEDRMMAAIHFVQDDIRYQAITLGLGGWVPNDPETILSRRFGDCKDKSLLLTRLARAFGADEAHVALVNTRSGSYLKTVMPSPSRFNHAITYIKHEGVDYWVDGTQSLMGGTWGELVSPNYKYALILAPGQTALSPMPIPMPETPSMEVQSVYDASRGSDYGVLVTGTATFRSSYANGARSGILPRGEDFIAESIHKSMENEFGEVEDVVIINLRDDREANVISYDWSTELLDPFELSLEADEDNVLEFTYKLSPPLRIASNWSRRNRALPLDIYEGLNYRVKRTVILPKGSDIELDAVSADPVTIRSGALDYDRSVSIEDNRVVSEIHIRTKADYVAADDAKPVFRNIRKIERVSDLTLNMPNDLPDTAKFEATSSG
ncbi:MAG: DUF3857 domain-containing transglutaminase family protein [Pseudomonadota bacterium]